MQECNHCSKSHPRHAAHCTSAQLGSGSMDNFRTSNCDSVTFTFPPPSPPPTLPTVILAWKHQKTMIHLLWEMTHTSWSHHSCCICCVWFRDINWYSKALSSLSVQCQFMLSCTRQHLQISSLSQPFSVPRSDIPDKKEEKAWEYLHTLWAPWILL